MTSCEAYREKLTDWYMGRLEAVDAAELEQHLDTCAGCRETLAATGFVLDSISNLQDPEPTAHMKADFRTMLDEFKKAEGKAVSSSFWSGLKRSWTLQPRLPLAYGLVVLVIAVNAVYWVSRNSRPGKDMQPPHVRVEEPNQTMMLTMLDNPIASERMKAVNYTGQMKQVDGRVISALLNTLNNDSNDNVRLSALEALARLADGPEVRAGLIQSIMKQDSPIVQIAIAEVMLKLQEKRSVGPLKELLKQRGLDIEVKDKIQETITKLI